MTLSFIVAEADQMGHLPIETEHILLDLAREGKGIAAFILTTAGLDLEQVRQVTRTGLRQSSLTRPTIHPQRRRIRHNGA